MPKTISIPASSSTRATSALAGISSVSICSMAIASSSLGAEWRTLPARTPEDNAIVSPGEDPLEASRMRKLNISLSDKFVDFIESQVASGEYARANEVVHDGRQLLQREKAAYREKILILRGEVGSAWRRRVPAVCRDERLPRSSPSWMPRM